MNSKEGEEELRSASDAISEVSAAKYKVADPFSPPGAAAGSLGPCDAPTATPGEGSCSSSVQVGEVALPDMVIAASGTRSRWVTVNPIRIRDALRTLARNKALRDRRLG